MLLGLSLAMGAEQSKGGGTEQQVATGGTSEQPKKKICCACPETKNARDNCIAQYGEERCGYLIEAHKRCLRDEGFNV